LHLIAYKISCRKGFFYEFAFDNKALESFVEFRSGENVGSSYILEFEFELRHIPSYE